MAKLVDRRHSIGGSDARIIMGKDEKALTRLWKEKRGEVERTDLSDVLIVQMGLVTDDQRRAIHKSIPWMAATLDGLVRKPAPCSRPNSCCMVVLGGGRR